MICACLKRGFHSLFQAQSFGGQTRYLSLKLGAHSGRNRILPALTIRRDREIWLNTPTRRKQSND
jgi:hypothetical protein